MTTQPRPLSTAFYKRKGEWHPLPPTSTVDVDLVDAPSVVEPAPTSAYRDGTFAVQHVRSELAEFDALVASKLGLRSGEQSILVKACSPEFIRKTLLCIRGTRAEYQGRPCQISPVAADVVVSAIRRFTDMGVITLRRVEPLIMERILGPDYDEYLF